MRKLVLSILGVSLPQVANDRFKATSKDQPSTGVGRVEPLTDATAVFVGHRLVADPEPPTATGCYRAA